MARNKSANGVMVTRVTATSMERPERARIAPSRHKPASVTVRCQASRSPDHSARPSAARGAPSAARSTKGAATSERRRTRQGRTRAQATSASQSNRCAV